MDGTKYTAEDWITVGGDKDEVNYIYKIFEELTKCYPTPQKKHELAGLLTMVLMFNSTSKLIEEPERLQRMQTRFTLLLRDLCSLYFNDIRTSVQRYKDLTTMISKLNEVKFILGKNTINYYNLVNTPQALLKCGGSQLMFEQQYKNLDFFF